jgi:hypothetical protein
MFNLGEVVLSAGWVKEGQVVLEGRNGVVVRFSLLSGAPVSLSLRACLLPTRRCVSGADQRGARHERLWTQQQGGNETAAGCAACRGEQIGSRRDSGGGRLRLALAWGITYRA